MEKKRREPKIHLATQRQKRMKVKERKKKRVFTCPLILFTSYYYAFPFTTRTEL